MNKIIPLLSIIALIGFSCANKPPQKYSQTDFRLPPIDLSSYEEQKKRPLQDKNLALAVAISGGGHRAANFGVGVLMALEEAKVLLVIDAYKDNPQPYSHKEGSPSAVEVALRIMGIGLDSNHTRFEDHVKSLCYKDDIKPIFLSFESLKKDDEERIIKEVRRAKTDAALTEGDLIKATNILYENARDVDTSFNITKDEQALLFQAGKTVVAKEMSKIIGAIGN